MDQKQQIVDSILESVRTQIVEFVELEDKIQCPIEYETRVLKMSIAYAQNLIMGSKGKLPLSRNAKKKL